MRMGSPNHGLIDPDLTDRRDASMHPDGEDDLNL